MRGLEVDDVSRDHTLCGYWRRLSVAIQIWIYYLRAVDGLIFAPLCWQEIASTTLSGSFLCHSQCWQCHFCFLCSICVSRAMARILQSSRAEFHWPRQHMGLIRTILVYGLPLFCSPLLRKLIKSSIECFDGAVLAPTISQIRGTSPNPAVNASLSAPCNVVPPLTFLSLTLLHCTQTVDSYSDGNARAPSVPAQSLRSVWSQLTSCVFNPLINICLATLFRLAANSLWVHNFVNPLQIQMTPFWACTFPHLLLTLRFRRVPLLRRRHGILTGCCLLSLLVFGHRDTLYVSLVRFGWWWWWLLLLL